MNIYSILQLCGGLAFFLFGMHVMSGSLEKLAGGNLQKILKEVTSNPIKSLFFGAIVTIAIQSSLSFARRLRRPIRYISQPIPTVREKPSHGICFTHLNLRARMSAVSALMRSRRMLSRNH